MPDNTAASAVTGCFKLAQASQQQGSLADCDRAVACRYSYIGERPSKSQPMCEEVIQNVMLYHAHPDWPTFDACMPRTYVKKERSDTDASSNHVTSVHQHLAAYVLL